jgi:hypothetical protein
MHFDIARLGTAKAHCYFAADFDRLSDCMFDLSQMQWSKS